MIKTETVVPFIMQFQEGHPITPAVFYWSHQPKLGADYTGCKYKEAGIIGSHLRGWLPNTASILNNEDGQETLA